MNLTIDQAENLADRLRCRVMDNGRERQLYAIVRGDRICFMGGRQGSHSLDISVSTVERIKAHWDGYCENNGHLYAAVGQLVEFPSASAPSGLRVGRVVSVGPDRLRVKFKYYHGGESTKVVPKHQCWLLRSQVQTRSE